MRTTHSLRRRTRRAVAVAALVPVLAFTAACNGDDGGSGDTDPSASSTESGDSSGTSGGEDGGQEGGTEGTSEGGTNGGGDGGDGQPESGVPPLTKEQLTKAALKTGDVPGWKIDTGEGIEDEDTLEATPAACQPIADVLGAKPALPRTANVGVTAMKGDFESGQVAPIMLSAYAPGDAEKLLDSLRAAVPNCASFKGLSGDGVTDTFTVTEVSEQLSAGDESFTFDLAFGDPGEEGTARVTVARTGGNTATYIGADLAAGKPVLIDQALVTKQHEKLKQNVVS